MVGSSTPFPKYCESLYLTPGKVLLVAPFPGGYQEGKGFMHPDRRDPDSQVLALAEFRDPNSLQVLFHDL